MDEFAFWNQHKGAVGFEVVTKLLGNAIRYKRYDTFIRHHFIRIAYEKGLDLSVVEPQLRRELDAVEWQFLTTGQSVELRDGLFPSFGIAPIVRKNVPAAYHATRACVIPLICNEGLLPSNSERKATTFPDTEGLIHVCEKLTCKEGENDSAEWWMEHLSKKNRFDDQHWGIVGIDMTGLPTNARVYEDMHSASGLIVDKVDGIPKELITVVRG